MDYAFRCVSSHALPVPMLELFPWSEYEEIAQRIGGESKLEKEARCFNKNIHIEDKSHTIPMQELESSYPTTNSEIHSELEEEAQDFLGLLHCQSMKADSGMSTSEKHYRISCWLRGQACRQRRDRRKAKFRQFGCTSVALPLVWVELYVSSVFYQIAMILSLHSKCPSCPATTSGISLVHVVMLFAVWFDARDS